MSRAFAAVGFVTLALSACAARGPVAPPASPTLEEALEHPEPAEQLRRDLRELFTAPAVDHAQWGVQFYSLGTGERLYSYNAFRLLLPASNQKLLTTSVAAERLGWDFRFTTRVLATGDIDSGGTLNGDLVVVGNGDPTINPRHPERWNVFDTWASELQTRGVRAINGRIIGDDNAFAEPGWGAGWSWDNLVYGYGTAVGALQFNENQVALRISPGPFPGAPAVVTADPPWHGLVIEPHVTTAAAGVQSDIDIARLPASSVLEVRGAVAPDAKPSTITVSVENPTLMYVNALRDALSKRGIAVSDAIDIDDLPAPPDLHHASELIVDRSAPLSEIIDVCLKWSRNEYSETLLRALSPPGAPATAAAGLDVVRAQLRTWGISPAFFAPIDGSGLSRQDYVSAEAFTWLLTYLWLDPKHTEMFRATLPVAGVSGTLADRMKGTPLEGRVFAKTGTLSSVRALSGYLITRSGEPVVFSMMANNYQLPTADLDATMEKALMQVYEYHR